MMQDQKNTPHQPQQARSAHDTIGEIRRRQYSGRPPVSYCVMSDSSVITDPNAARAAKQATEGSNR